jgi:putative spermidine/putrescine transport system ATP-binding protein
MTALGPPDELVSRSGAGTAAGAGTVAGTGSSTGVGWAGGMGEQGARAGTSVVLRNLCCRFGTVQALDGFSLDIGPGEFVALLGPSGCGKTTALRILAGFENATSGEVLVNGQDVQAIPPQRREMGMVFQSYSLFPNMTVIENVAFGLRLRKVGSTERKKQAMSLLEMVELKDRANRYPHQLSGGQQQRVALARALAIEPRVLLLDEPLSALDAKVRVQLRDQIRALQRRLAITTVFVTHDQDEALSMADRVAVMRAGQLEQVAPPAELYDNPQTAFVAEFVGTMNRLPAKVVRPGTVAVLGREVAARGAQASSSGQDVHVLVRPESLAVSIVPGANGIVTGVTFRGAQSRVDVLLWADVAVKVDMPSSEAIGMTVGSSVDVRLLPDEVLVDAKGEVSVPREEG